MSNQKVNFKSNEFKPSPDYVLVKPADTPDEKVTAGGIIIPMMKTSVVLDRKSSGIVIEVGEEIEDIKKGDFVIWPNTDGLDLEFTDGEFLLIRYKSIIGRQK